MALNGRVEGGQRRLGRRVLGHVGGLASGFAVVVQPRRFRGHQCRDFDFDFRLREGVRNALVSADRGVPHHSLVGVPGGLVQGVAPDPDAERGPGDPLGVQPVKDLPEAFALDADQSVGAHSHVVEEQRELPFRQRHRDRQRLREQSRGAGVDEEQRQRGIAGALVGAGAGHDEDGICLVHAGDVVLLPL